MSKTCASGSPGCGGGSNVDSKKVFEPKNDYNLSLKIQGLEYINYTEYVKIITSITTGYQIFQFRINMDPEDLAKNDVMRSEPLKLQIKIQGEAGELTTIWNFELQCIRVDSVFPTTKLKVTSGKEKVRTPVTLVAIPKKSLKAVNTIVNKIYINQTPKQIVSDLVSQSGATLKMDSDNCNSQNIKQCLITPTTVYKAIRLIDDNYGIYDGASNLGFCDHDGNFFIQNLTAKIKKGQTFTIYQLASDINNEKLVQECITSDNKFYTYGNIIPDYSGVTKVLAMAPKNYFIVHPFDDLYDKIEKDVTGIYKSHGLISKVGEYKDYKHESRERYIHRHSGFEHDETFMNARIGRKLANISSLVIQIEKSLMILKLMKVGECVKFINQSEMFKKLSGKYILKASDITFDKLKNMSRGGHDWVAGAKIILMRTNQYD